MGRYYDGDIEGKFWFAVQNSNDASYFGGTMHEPNSISYSFSKEEDLESLQEGIKTCKKELRGYKKKLDDFFKRSGSYNNEKLAKTLDVEESKVAILLEWYARLELGEKILKCVKDKGYCDFDAEL